MSSHPSQQDNIPPQERVEDNVGGGENVVAAEPALEEEQNQDQLVVANALEQENRHRGEHLSAGSSTQTTQDYDNIEVTFTEKEVLRKISDLKDKLKIRAASVRKPTQFDEQKTDIKDFVADFDNYSDVIGLQKTDCYATFLSYLGERHKNKLRNLDKSPGQKENWDTIKYDIIDAITPPAQKLEAKLKLNKARQTKDETLVDYSERIKRLVDQCYDRPSEFELRDRIMKDYLVKGCRNDSVAVEMMSKMETLTPQDLIKAGMAKELALKSRKMETSQTETKELEDSIAVLTVTDAPKSTYDQQAETHKQYSTNQQRPQIDRQNLVCFNCNKPGHFASNCRDRKRKNQQECWNCGRSGHYARDCRQTPNMANGANGYRNGKKRGNHFENTSQRQFHKPNFQQYGPRQQPENNSFRTGRNTNYPPISRTVRFEDRPRFDNQANYTAKPQPTRSPVNLMASAEKAPTERTPGILPISSIQRKIINEQAAQDSDEDFGLTLDSDSDFEYDLN